MSPLLNLIDLSRDIEEMIARYAPRGITTFEMHHATRHRGISRHICASAVCITRMRMTRNGTWSDLYRFTWEGKPLKTLGGFDVSTGTLN